MSALQWALLLFGVVAVVAIYFYSRRDHRSGDVFGADTEGQGSRTAPTPFERQMDIFGSGGQFDDLGVGRARRIAPDFDDADGEDESMDAPAATISKAPPRVAHYAPEEDEPAQARPPKRSLFGGRGEPRTAKAPATAERAPERQPDRMADRMPERMADRGYERPQEKPQDKVQEKLISLLIAERDGAQIQGESLHIALQEQGLEYGVRQIYHRVVDGQPVFSVASLVKPGVLDPDLAVGFQTPGLAVFMVLPGPVAPLEAFQDMLRTAQALAGALNAEVYDNRKKPLTSASILVLRSDVDAWAQTQGRELR